MFLDDTLAVALALPAVVDRVPVLPRALSR
jgi:hypothetical protein